MSDNREIVFHVDEYDSLLCFSKFSLYRISIALNILIEYHLTYYFYSKKLLSEENFSFIMLKSLRLCGMSPIVMSRDFFHLLNILPAFKNLN